MISSSASAIRSKRAGSFWPVEGTDDSAFDQPVAAAIGFDNSPAGRFAPWIDS